MIEKKKGLVKKTGKKMGFSEKTGLVKKTVVNLWETKNRGRSPPPRNEIRRRTPAARFVFICCM